MFVFSKICAGESKHKLKLEGPSATVDDLKVLIQGTTEVPPEAQKIIFKGEHSHCMVCM